MSYRLVSTLICSALLSACASTQEAPTNQPAAASSTAKTLHNSSNLERCNSSAADQLLGRTGSEPLLEQARQQAGAQRARMLGEDDMMTMDYDSQRLNLYLDAQGKIKLITCG